MLLALGSPWRAVADTTSDGGNVSNDAERRSVSYEVIHAFVNAGTNPASPLAQGRDGNFYGTAPRGGAYGFGTVFKVTPTGEFSTLHSFNVFEEGRTPTNGVIQARDGNFYGTTSEGGASGGTAFKITPTGTFTHLNSLARPSRLIQARDGNFYGTTEGGIAGGIFKMDAAGTVTVLHEFSFTGAEGFGGTAGLIQARDGNFYGATGQGGAFFAGAFFKMDAAGTVSTLHSFGAGNAAPTAPLIEARDGNFYGTTQATVFKLDGAGNLTPLHSFDCATEGCAASGLVQARDGNFYGTTLITSSGFSGTVFKMNTRGTLIPLHFFDCATEGCEPFGLIQAGDGNFYGTTRSGGSGNPGTVYRMDAAGRFAFFSMGCGSQGCQPAAPLIQARDGNLYGTTRLGGVGEGDSFGIAPGGGTAFRLDDSGRLKTLHRFECLTEGCLPAAALIQARDGNFYGTAEYSLAPAVVGSIFRMTANRSFENLHFLDCAVEGCAPRAGLVQARDENFYGTAYFGGVTGLGTVFKIQAGGALTTLHSFECGFDDGCFPRGGLVQARNGDLYGTTESSPGFAGTVFRIDLQGALTTLHSFDCTTGCLPAAVLIQARDGSFYGTTRFDSTTGSGSVFKISINGEFTTVHAFDCATGGCTPIAGLIQAFDGSFYGTTQFGGPSNGGTIFKIDTRGTFTTLHTFDCATEGCQPVAGLVQTRDGDFYGTASTGGRRGGGVVFRLKPGGK